MFAEQLMKENPLVIVMKLMALILDLKLKSTTIVSISVKSHYTITNHYVMYVRTLRSIIELLIYSKGIVTSQTIKVHSRDQFPFHYTGSKISKHTIITLNS